MKEPRDLEPTVEHVQVGEEAIKKAVDVIKNYYWKIHKLWCWLHPGVLWRILRLSLCFHKS
jgi:hypothetical protein